MLLLLLLQLLLHIRRQWTKQMVCQIMQLRFIFYFILKVKFTVGATVNTAVNFICCCQQACI
jgi:hypothetical protein